MIEAVVKAASIVIVAAIVLAAYWLWWPVSVLGPATSTSFSVANPGRTVIAGNQILYTGETEQLTEGIGVTSLRRLIGPIMVSLPSVMYVTNRQRVTKDQVFAIDIPTSVPSGEYVLEVTMVYAINPLRDVSIRRKTETFQISNPGLDKLTAEQRQSK